MLNSPCESKTPISSSNHKSVFLREWWLIEVKKDSRLGVGGFTNRETLGSRGMRLLGSASFGKRCNLNSFKTEMQVFQSAAIAKRLDNNTLEAIDGITITISGCMNKSRTLSCGFLPEVCDRFLSGFPHNWEEYAAKSAHGKCASRSKRSLPLSFDDLPVTQARDMLMSTTRESEACAFTSIIFRDIQKQSVEKKSHNQTASSVEPDDKDSMNSTKTELDHKQDAVSSLNQTQKILEDDHKMDSKETENNDNQGNGGFMSDLTKKAQEEICIQVQSDPLSKAKDPELSSSQRRCADEGNTKTTTKKQASSGLQQQRYALRSKLKK